MEISCCPDHPKYDILVPEEVIDTLKRFLILLLLCAALFLLPASAEDSSAFCGHWYDTVNRRAWMRVDSSSDGTYTVHVT